MTKIKEINDLGTSCPSQWYIELDDGRFVYARYRWGNLGFGIGDTETEAVHDHEYGEQLGDEFDGVMDTDTMLSHLEKWLSREPQINRAIPSGMTAQKLRYLADTLDLLTKMASDPGLLVVRGEPISDRNAAILRAWLANPEMQNDLRRWADEIEGQEE